MKDELIYHEYAGWLLENDNLIKRLRGLNSLIYERIKYVLDVVDYFYNKLIDDPNFNDEDHNIFETGFYYAYDQIEEIRELLEDVYLNDFDKLNEDSDIINLLLSTIDFQNELVSHEKYEDIDMQFLLDFESEILDKLNKKEKIEDSMIKKFDDETYKIFTKMDIEYYPLDEIFIEIAYQIGIVGNE